MDDLITALTAVISALNKIPNTEVHIDLNGEYYRSTYDLLPALEKILEKYK